MKEALERPRLQPFAAPPELICAFGILSVLMCAFVLAIGIAARR